MKIIQGIPKSYRSPVIVWSYKYFNHLVSKKEFTEIINNGTNWDLSLMLVEDDDEEEDTRDYSEFEATIQEPVFPPMTDQEFKEKTVLALDQEEGYSRMSPEERNKFWVLKDHLEAETKRRQSL